MKPDKKLQLPDDTLVPDLHRLAHVGFGEDHHFTAFHHVEFPDRGIIILQTKENIARTIRSGKHILIDHTPAALISPEMMRAHTELFSTIALIQPRIDLTDIVETLKNIRGKQDLFVNKDHDFLHEFAMHHQEEMKRLREDMKKAKLYNPYDADTYRTNQEKLRNKHYKSKMTKKK